MTRKEIDATIGSFGIITGNRRISPDGWKRSFPQDWFGRVIGFEKGKFIVRCYRPKRKDSKKHPHIHCEPKYLKLI